ncbi:hypothetical protein E2C01_024085 [Portunus trituberculatus]|uniref:Uncharacterized protein n=1 Tax=Portunus trituberculatus TaxID=210409 RepID=A0A5B7EBN3_PORTR|nr:hypothetical protein [Portunus trituberculatus]
MRYEVNSLAFSATSSSFLSGESSLAITASTALLFSASGESSRPNLSRASVPLLRAFPVLAESVGSMAMSWAEFPLVEKFLVAAKTSSSSSSASSPNDKSLKFLDEEKQCPQLIFFLNNMK